MAQTTWNPSDKSANITLSGANLVVTVGGTSTGQGVRTVDSLGSGKFYWEYTWTTSQSNFQVIIGVGTASAAFATVAGNIVGAAAIQSGDGGIYVNNTTSLAALGAIAQGNIIGLAVDVGGKLIWFRKAPSGNWNNSGTANPATGAGGFSISALTLPVYGLQASGVFNPGDVITANFGGSAFSGAVPAGFTSGFPLGGSGASGGAAQARAMMLA